MNHAAVSPPSLRVIKAVESLLIEFSHCGISYYPQWMKRVDEVRRLFTQLINADPDEVAFIGNTSQGLSTIAAGIRWRKGDIVLIPEHEFPANVYPWMNLERQGVKVNFFKRREGRLEIKEIENALRPGTKLISVSSVDFATGFRCNLKAVGDVCHRKGLLFCVDAIQSLGVIPMDVRELGIHFLASGGHKWLLSTMGCGALFISKDVNELVHPEVVGWKSVSDDENFFRLQFDLKPDARRFEPGTMNVQGIYALGSAIELILELNVNQIFHHVIGINDLLFRGLRKRGFHIASPMGHGERSGILSFVPSSNPKTLHSFLTKNNVMTSLRGHMIRLSPHFYNNADDVERFFEVLDNF